MVCQERAPNIQRRGSPILTSLQIHDVKARIIKSNWRLASQDLVQYFNEQAGYEKVEADNGRGGLIAADLYKILEATSQTQADVINVIDYIRLHSQDENINLVIDQHPVAIRVWDFVKKIGPDIVSLDCAKSPLGVGESQNIRETL